MSQVDRRGQDFNQQFPLKCWPHSQSYIAFIMSLEQHTPTKTKKTCACFLASHTASQQPSCPDCQIPAPQNQKEEMPPLSPVTTPRSKVTPACREPDFFEEIPVIPLRREQKDKKRCFNCNKKLGLLGVQCKCGYVYCGGHRLPQNHGCDFDHRKVAMERLKGELRKVAKAKIQEI